MHTHMHTCTPRVHTHTLTACKRELSSPPSDSNAAKRGRRNVRDSKVGGMGLPRVAWHIGMRQGWWKGSGLVWCRVQEYNGMRQGWWEGSGLGWCRMQRVKCVNAGVWWSGAMTPCLRKPVLLRQACAFEELAQQIGLRLMCDSQQQAKRACE